MATLDDIREQRDAAIAILQRKIDEANDLMNHGASELANTIDALVTEQADIAAQAYSAGLDDPTMSAALAALRAATADMNRVAARMVSATAILAHAASFLTAADKVIPALKGARGTG